MSYADRDVRIPFLESSAKYNSVGGRGGGGKLNTLHLLPSPTVFHACNYCMDCQCNGINNSVNAEVLPSFEK